LPIHVFIGTRSISRINPSWTAIILATKPSFLDVAVRIAAIELHVVPVVAMLANVHLSVAATLAVRQAILCANLNEADVARLHFALVVAAVTVPLVSVVALLPRENFDLTIAAGHWTTFFEWLCRIGGVAPDAFHRGSAGCHRRIAAEVVVAQARFDHGIFLLHPFVGVGSLLGPRLAEMAVPRACLAPAILQAVAGPEGLPILCGLFILSRLWIVRRAAQCFELVEFRLNVADIHFRKGQLIRGYRLPALDPLLEILRQGTLIVRARGERGLDQ